MENPSVFDVSRNVGITNGRFDDKDQASERREERKGKEERRREEMRKTSHRMKWIE